MGAFNQSVQSVQSVQEQCRFRWDDAKTLKFVALLKEQRVSSKLYASRITATELTKLSAV